LTRISISDPNVSSAYYYSDQEKEDSMEAAIFLIRVAQFFIGRKEIKK
jgi:hypothetical protein